MSEGTGAGVGVDLREARAERETLSRQAVWWQKYKKQGIGPTIRRRPTSNSPHGYAVFVGSCVPQLPASWH
jgi:hypothetical protein